MWDSVWLEECVYARARVAQMGNGMVGKCECTSEVGDEGRNRGKRAVASEWSQVSGRNGRGSMSHGKARLLDRARQLDFESLERLCLGLDARAATAQVALHRFEVRKERLCFAQVVDVLAARGLARSCQKG